MFLDMKRRQKSTDIAAFRVSCQACLSLTGDNYIRDSREYLLSHCIVCAEDLYQSKMSLLRPQYASRLLQAGIATHQRLPPCHIRWASKTSGGEYQDRSAQPAPKSDASTSPAPTSSDTSMINQQGPGEGMVDHQPDYHAPIDHGTSLA